MRILIGLILVLSVSFACDQPYEEFEGYKIGCPFEDNNSEFKLVESMDKFSVYQKDTNGFFDSINIIVLDGSIEGLEFRKNVDYLGSSIEAFNQDKAIAKDVKILIHKINEQFGENITISTDRAKMVWFPNNEIIKAIDVSIPTIKNNNFDVKIFSKQLSNYFYSMNPKNSQ